MPSDAEHPIEVVRPKVLVVGMLDSPHFGRWLQTLRDIPADICLFPSTPNRRLHPKVKELTELAGSAKFRLSGPECRLSALLWLVDLVAMGTVRVSLLRYRLKFTKPDLLHSVEIQHAGYLVQRALKSRSEKVPAVAVTNYGSDIFWFGRFPFHKRRISSLLGIANFYAAECHRDVVLAQAFGFRGEVLTVLPNAGGLLNSQEFDVDKIIKAAHRNVVLIKGYTNFVGLAQEVIQALYRTSANLGDWEFVVYSATLRARAQVWWYSLRRRDFHVKAFKKRKLSHTEMISLFSTAAAYVGFSKSDGASTSFLEALAFGAYPLQTTTACIDEWESRGALFSALDVNSPDLAVDELMRVLGDVELREIAAERNTSVAKKYLDRQTIAKTIENDYRNILGL